MRGRAVARRLGCGLRVGRPVGVGSIVSISIVFIIIITTIKFGIMIIIIIS